MNLLRVKLNLKNNMSDFVCEFIELAEGEITLNQLMRVCISISKEDIRKGIEKWLKTTNTKVKVKF